MADEGEYLVDKECVNINNNNIKIIENTKTDGNKEYSYVINAFIVKASAANKQNNDDKYNVDNLLKEINNKIPDNSICYIVYDSNIESDNNEQKLTKIVKQKLFNRDFNNVNDSHLLADMWNCRANILIMCIKPDKSEFFDFTDGGNFFNVSTLKDGINEYKMTLQFTPPPPKEINLISFN